MRRQYVVTVTVNPDGVLESAGCDRNRTVVQSVLAKKASIDDFSLLIELHDHLKVLKMLRGKQTCGPIALRRMSTCAGGVKIKASIDDFSLLIQLHDHLKVLKMLRGKQICGPIALRRMSTCAGGVKIKKKARPLFASSPPDGRFAVPVLVKSRRVTGI
jgi:hypothetical protein